MPKGVRFAAFAIFVALSVPAHAGTVNAAIAANFTSVADQLAVTFKAQTGHDLVPSYGATGALYAQITQGAPFHVFLSADDKRTAIAVGDGLAVAGTDFTYAVGKLVLYSTSTDVTDGPAVLASGAFHHIAIANPDTAPYGAAAMAVLDKLGLTALLAPKIVTGENVTQTLQFIETGNAELGFVALSQVIGKPTTQIWLPLPEDYPPIRQNAVLLKQGEANQAAIAFLDFLRSPEALAIIAAAGYEVE